MGVCAYACFCACGSWSVRVRVRVSVRVRVRVIVYICELACICCGECAPVLAQARMLVRTHVCKRASVQEGT